MSAKPKSYLKIVRSISISVAATITSVISLNFFPVPFAWIALAWFVVTAYHTVSSDKPNLKFLWLNISVIVFTLGGFEAYLLISDNSKPSVQVEGDGGATVRDEFLGYVPLKNHRGFELKHYGSELIYKVIYSIGANGLRVTSPYKGAERETDKIPCVLFFGDSFTFGSGVNDQETMPYLIGSMLDTKYITYNFAVHGYGPHQMLSQLEHEVVKNSAKCKPKYAVYQAILPQIERSAGLAFWDSHGPKYVLGSKGIVEYRGNFDDYPDSISTRIASQLKKSLILSKAFFSKQQPTKSEVDLFIAIIDASKHRFESDYPNSEFHVILWDSKGEMYRNRVLKGFKQKGIKTHLISNILPNYETEQLRYVLSDHDKHPNLLANKIIAEYVTKNIVKELK